MSLSGATEAVEPALRTCAVVLGMHRSGTSALANMLGLLGFGLPRTRMPSNEWNVAGYAESLAIEALNTRLLERLGTRWDDWRPVTLSALDAVSSFRAEAAGILQAEFQGDAPFVLKDPRICRLFPFWSGVLAEIGAAPLFVLPVRHPAEVAASLAARESSEAWFNLLMWQRHVIDAERGTRGRPRVFTSYDGLLADWRQVASGIAGALSLDWPRPLPQAAGEVDALLSPRLRHHVVDRDVDLPPLVYKLYGILGRWAREGESAADFAELDRIREAFDAACASFSGYADRTVALAGEILHLKVDVDASHDREAALARQNQHLQAGIADALGRESGLQARIANLEEEAALALRREAGLSEEMRGLTQRITALEARRFVLPLWRRGRR